ncbi:MAG TPA: sulfatase-like hydrolase/transferase [Thermoanaerobaculia bacterium]
MKPGGAAAVALALVALAGCARRDGAPGVVAGTPVVLISIDTLRSDHLPAYGYRGVETPAIDALRRDGVLFERAYTVTPLTFPAHASLLTGLWPEAHGVRDNVGYPLDEARIAAGELPYLPHLLRAAGYATGAAVSAYVLQGRGGLRAGFDLYEDDIEYQTGRGLGGLQRRGGETLGPALEWLRDVAGRPFFLFLHLYEPHTPYDPPAPFARPGRSPYDGEIAAADAVVGDLVAELRRLEVYDRAIVLLVSDHGEGLGEHGELEHGVLLYREAIQVPLLLKLPGRQRAGTGVAAPVSLVDVAPTLAELLDLPRSPAWPGRSLLTGGDRVGGATGERAIYAETFYPRLHFGWSELAAVVQGDHHLIAGPDPELYDLRRDPAERRNLRASERRSFAALRRALDDHDRRLRPPAAVDEESRRAMIALGYVGGGGAAGPAGEPLPDPKTRVGSLGDLQTGFRHAARHEHAAAAAAFRRVLAENPRMPDAWEFLGHSLAKLERPEEALAAYREALRASAGSPHVAMSAASLYLELGRLEEAEQHARLALVAHPSFAHGLLAQIALARGDLAAAERAAQASAEAGSVRVRPLLTLAAVRHAQERYEEALRLIDQAVLVYRERKTPDPELLQGLHLLRGRALADLGDVAAAETAFQREIELFPADPRAYANLALLYALAGRPRAVGPTLRRMVEDHPSAAAYAEAVKTLRVLELRAEAERVLRRGRRLYPGNPLLTTLVTNATG